MNPGLIKYSKKKLEICYAAQIGGSIMIISLLESGGGKVVLLGAASFVKVIHQIVMGMVHMRSSISFFIRSSSDRRIP